MTCWHCSTELELITPVEESHKLYHCSDCDRWYEMFKEKSRINGAIPVRFLEMDHSPQILTANSGLSL